MKRIFSSILCGLLVASVFAGCGNNGGSSSSGSSGTPVNSDSSSSDNTGVTMSAPGEYPIVNEKVTYTVMAPQTNYILDLQTNAYTQWLEEKTNVHIEYETVPEAALTEKVNLSLASSEIPDAYLSCNIDSASQVKYGKEGVFVDMAPLIEQYGYEIPKAYEANNLLPGAVTTPDGEIFALAGVNECYHCLYCGRAWINQTWLDNLGLDYPETTEDFVNVLRAFKEQDANGNGDPNDEIPMLGISGMWRASCYDFLLGSFVYNDFTDRLSVENGTVNYVANTEEFRNGLRFIRSLIEEELIDPVSLTITEDEAHVLTGGDVATVGVATGMAYWNVLSANDEEYIGLSPLEGPNGVRNAFVRATGIVSGQFTITNKAENPEILFRWADAQFSEEATYFSSWGPEGEGWEKAPEGTLGINGKQALYVVLDGVNNTGAETIQNLAMPNIALANRTSDFRLGQAVGGDDKSEERLYEAASKYYYPYAKEQTYPLMVMSAEDSAVVNEYKTAINAYVDEMISGFLAGTYDLDKDWDSYLSEFDALGLEDYLNVLQSAYDKVYK